MTAKRACLRSILPLLALLGALCLAVPALADTFHLISPTASGVSIDPGQSLTTASTANSGFSPTQVLGGSPAYWYSQPLSGSFSGGTWNLVLWTQAPGCASNVTAEIGSSAPDGSGYSSLGQQTLDLNLPGNHPNNFSFSVPFLNLVSRVLRVKLVLSSGCGSTLAYNAGVDFDSRLISPVFGPNGTPTVSPTATLSPTPTRTPVPPLTKSVNTASAVLGQTLTYTLNYKNPNPATHSSCGDDFEDGSTLWPTGWNPPTGGIWARSNDNGPSASGSKALDAQSTGGFHYSTLGCAQTVTDGKLQVDAKILTGSGELSLLWRQGGSSTYQFHVVQGSAANVSLRVITQGAFNEIALTGYAINLGQWYTLKLVVSGFTLSAYINGVQVLSATDPNTTYTAGAAGLEIDDAPATGMHAVFDNVQLTEDQLDWYGVTIIDTLPAGLTYVSNSCGATVSGQTVSLQLGTLAAGTQGSCQILAVANSCPATLHNQADFHVALPAMHFSSNTVHSTVACSTPTATRTRTATRSPSPSATRTASPSATPSATPTASPSPSRTITLTLTPSVTPTATRSASPTLSASPSATLTATRSASPTQTASPTQSETPTETPSHTPSRSITVSPSASATLTATATQTPSRSPSPSPTDTPTLSASPSQTPSITASPTRTPSPSQTPSPVPLPFQLRAGIYNAAGELVRALFEGSASNAPNGIRLSQSLLLPGSSVVQALLNARLSDGSAGPIWDGRNSQAQWVSAGVYYLKIESTDPFGQTDASTLAVQVLPSDPSAMTALSAYNSAGERVASIPVSPSAGISDIEALNSVLVPGVDPLRLRVTALDGTTHAVQWDGIGELGSPLKSGTYTLRARGLAGSQSDRQWSFAVLDAPGQRPSAPLIAPNPVPSSAASLRIVAPGGGCAWRMDAFDLTGSLVAQAQGRPGQDLRLALRDLGPGVYLVHVQARDGQGQDWQWTLKAALLR